MTRRVLAEAVGTAFLLLTIVGSGVGLGASDGGGLVSHALAVGAVLAALIVFLGPISGAHFNPAVTLAFLRRGVIRPSTAAAYVAAQVAGACAGVVLAHVTFGLPPVEVSATARSGAGLVVSELLTTFGLALLIVVLVAVGKAGSVAPAAGGWVASAILATSSTGFANPAVTVARVLTDTPVGIAPGSAAGFVAAQLAAGLGAAAVAGLLVRSDVSSTSPSPTR